MAYRKYTDEQLLELADKYRRRSLPMPLTLQSEMDERGLAVDGAWTDTEDE